MVGVVVTHPMEKVLDSTLHRPFEGVIEIDVDGVAERTQVTVVDARKKEIVI